MYLRPKSKLPVELYRCVTLMLGRYTRCLYPFDYDTPAVRSEFLQGKHKEMHEQFASFSNEAEYVEAFVNVKRSKGNFFKDMDNNTILDLYMGNGSMPLGYNHYSLLFAQDSKEYDKFKTHNVNLSQYPPIEYPDILRETMMPCAPKGLNDVQLTSQGGQYDLAYKLALLKY